MTSAAEPDVVPVALLVSPRQPVDERRDSRLSGVMHACAVLDLFIAEKHAWGVRDLGRRMGISKSHAHRLLTTLAAMGYLEHQHEGARYVPGLKLVALGAAAVDVSPLLSSGQAAARLAVKQTGLDARVGVWERDDVLTIQPANEPAVTRRPFGECYPSSVVLLAARPPGSASESRFTQLLAETTGLTVQRLGMQVSHVRAGGLVASVRSNRGVHTVAAPIMGRDRAVVAAFYARVPVSRWDSRQREVLRTVRNSARRVSESLLLTAHAGDGLQCTAAGTPTT